MSTISKFGYTLPPPHGHVDIDLVAVDRSRNDILYIVEAFEPHQIKTCTISNHIANMCDVPLVVIQHYSGEYDESKPISYEIYYHNERKKRGINTSWKELREFLTKFLKDKRAIPIKPMEHFEVDFS